MFGTMFAISTESRSFEHREAFDVFDRALLAMRDRDDVRTIVFDMSRVSDATTSAFARLVLLRKELLREGRDLRISGLHDRAARLYEISRLDKVLPLA